MENPVLVRATGWARTLMLGPPNPRAMQEVEISGFKRYCIDALGVDLDAEEPLPVARKVRIEQVVSGFEKGNESFNFTLKDTNIPVSVDFFKSTILPLCRQWKARRAPCRSLATPCRNPAQL